MKTLVLYTALFFVPIIGFAQLVDPFGKIVTHEIKLNKQNDGTYVGAVEWTTGGLDSLQRYVIKGLDVKAPVLVRIISKAPNHNIDLSFHKKGWDKIESTISTNGNKFVDKVFRTMNTAGLGVHSKIGGIPYLITVKVGLQFPSTKSMIRLTDDRDEYTAHLRKMGYTGALFADDNNSNLSQDSNSDSSSLENNSTLFYIVIGLLIVVIILLSLFLVKRKPNKAIIVLIFLGIAQFSIAQSSGPRNIPIAQLKPVLKDYKTQNINNQSPIGGENPNVQTVTIGEPVGDSGVILNQRTVRIETNQGSRQLSPEEIKNLNSEIIDRDRDFDIDYVENNPGVATDGDQRTLPANITNEELNRLRRQVQRLQQQVDLLSQEDESFDDEDGNGLDGEVLLYCEDIEACRVCLDAAIDKFNRHLVYWNYLQKFYLSEVDELNDKIEYGNTLASMPAYGIAWGPILTKVIRPAMNNLKDAYNKKFNEYIESIEADFASIKACYQGPNGRFRSNESYEIQAYSIINSLKAARINK